MKPDKTTHPGDERPKRAGAGSKSRAHLGIAGSVRRPGQERVTRPAKRAEADEIDRG